MAASMSKQDTGRTGDIDRAREETTQVTRTANEISRIADQVSEGTERQVRSLVGGSSIANQPPTTRWRRSGSSR